MKKLDDALGKALVLGALVLAWWVVELDRPFSNYRPRYTIVCVAADGGRCGAWATGPKVTYGAFPESQVVVANTEAGASRLSACVVFDVDNWQCSSALMSDGEVLDTESGPMQVKYVPRWRWLYWKYANSGKVRMR